MTNQQKLTISDIAKLANVSIATVSRYLNGQLNQMSEATAQKIKKIITETDYIRNSAAVQLAKKRSNLVAVVASNIDEYFSSEYFKGIVSILSAFGYIGVLLDSDSNLKTEKAHLESVYNQNFAGIILQPLTTDSAVIRKFLNHNMPIVLIDRELADLEMSSVTTNNFEIAKYVMAQLSPDSFSSVTVITEPVKKLSTRVARVAGIKTVFDQVNVIETRSEHFDVNQLATTVDLNNPKNLLVVLKEPLLIQLLTHPSFLMQAHQTQNITGFIDTAMPRYLAPNFKFIQQSPYLMGASAAEILIKHLSSANNDYQQNIQNIIVPSHYK